MSLAITSQMAFEKVKVTKREGEVFEAFRQLGLATNDDIAELLGWPINCVTGRTNGLVKKSYLQLVDSNGKTRMGNRAKRWSVIEQGDELANKYYERDCGV